jgi:phosphatidate cytidylyltransferase
MTEARKSDLPTRFAAGVVMASVAFAAAYFGGWPFRILAALAAGIMLLEWCDMHGLPRRWAWIGGGLVLFVLLGGIEYFYPDPGFAPTDDGGEIDVEDFQPALAGFASIVAAGAVLALASRRIILGWGFIYVGVPTFSLLLLSWTFGGLVFWVLAVTIATDVCAYFAGRSIGGPKLAPRISPNKTWAGLAGGVIGGGLAGYGIFWLFDVGAPFHWLGAPMAVVAQAGDLYESWEKRRAGIKDSGSLLPGHGGVLDRLDGMLAVSFVTALLLIAGFWTE